MVVQVATGRNPGDIDVIKSHQRLASPLPRLIDTVVTAAVHALFAIADLGVVSERSRFALEASCFGCNVEEHLAARFYVCLTPTRMPFSTERSWPEGLISMSIFRIARQEDHREFLSRSIHPAPPILLCGFGNNFEFYVAPQAPPRDCTWEEAVSAVFMVIFDSARKPVLLVKVKDHSWLNLPSARRDPDAQMRRSFDDLLSMCPNSTLYGLSLIGTRARVYSGDVGIGLLTPPPVEHANPNRVLPGSFLRDAWDVDILSGEGLVIMRDIVRTVIEQPAQNPVPAT